MARMPCTQSARVALGALAFAGATWAHASAPGIDALPAIPAIVEQARGRQVVILNEAHDAPRHRAFALQLARELGKLGFEYLACEAFALDLRPDALTARGYPHAGDGFYIREPFFGDFVRESLKLGYKPVSYEAPAQVLMSKDPDRVNQREAAQASNIVERVLKQHPSARIFIYVGWDHLMKKPHKTQRFGEVIGMAGRLRAATGIDPLTIDQTSSERGAAEVPDGAAILADAFRGRDDESVVLARKDERRDFVVLGRFAGDADMQVWHRPERFVNGRPGWMSMKGYRRATDIPAELIPGKGKVMVQAFKSEEDSAAVAVDQVCVDSTAAKPVLMLPAGTYRYSTTDCPKEEEPSTGGA